MCVVIMALKMSIHIWKLMQVVIMILEMNVFSESNPVVMFAEASIYMKCKIQTLCINSNICVNYTPPEVMNEDCVKILYYHHEDFTMCQRVVEIRMNEGNIDSSKQLGLDFLVINVTGRNENVKFDYENFLSC